MVQSDTLSRRPDLCPDDDTDNEDMTLLPDKLFVKAIDVEMHDLIAAHLMKDNIVKDAIQVLKSQGTPPIKLALEDRKFKEGLLFFKNRCYVPDTLSYGKELWNNTTTLLH
jgi:hypothetical protein